VRIIDRSRSRPSDKWSQLDQGMTKGEGDKPWQYGGKLEALARVDLSKQLVGDDLR
jgi:hypothetical protein